MSKKKLERTQLFGDAKEMGSDADLEKELSEADAENAALEEAEREAAEDTAFQAKMAKRGTRGLSKIC